jgi:sulfane dehydrogenase subunit SoxC
MAGKWTDHPEPGNPAAGNGILSRRVFLEGAFVAVSTSLGLSNASAEPLTVPSWMKVPGAGFAAYGQPSRFEDKVVRAALSPPNPPTPGVGTARTPLHLLDGTSLRPAFTSNAAIPASPISTPTNTGS